MAPNMEKVTSEDEKVKAITSKYPDHFELLTDRSKVLCKLTKHELPLNAAALQTYIDGKKFQYYLNKVKKPSKLQKMDTQYSQYFRESKKSSSRLFCTLTKKEINKQPHEIERYITGYKFLKAVAKDRERKEKGIEEPQMVAKEKDKEDGVEEAEDEDEVPFYALSSEGEGDDAGEGEGEDGEDDVIDSDDIDLGDVSEKTEDIDSKVEVVKEGSDGSGGESAPAGPSTNKGKKRKTKLEKLKKDKKKSKKLKAAGE